MKKLDERLEALLLQESFEDLSRENRDWVLTQIDAETFTAMRQTLLESQRAFQQNQPTPNPAIQAALRKKVSENKAPQPAAKLLAYRIPAWQAVAAACVLFVLFANFKSKFIAPPETVYVHLTDTVYKDVPFRLVDSTAETMPDTNAQIMAHPTKKINQSPRQRFHKNTFSKKKKDTLPVGLPELNNSFAATYDTAVLNSVINDFLFAPADNRRSRNHDASLDLIERVY